MRWLLVVCTLLTVPPAWAKDTPWIDEARKHLGASGSIVGMKRNWCAAFLNKVLKAAGKDGTDSLAAISFRSYGEKISVRPGAIAVLPHHVGIVTAVHGKKVTLLSGNHRRKVAYGKYTRSRILAYRWPSR